MKSRLFYTPHPCFHGRDNTFGIWIKSYLKKCPVSNKCGDSPGLTHGQRYVIEEYPQKKEQKKPIPGISRAEGVPTHDEIETLIREADRRPSLMIRVLLETLCRISEMLGAEIGKTRRGARVTNVEVEGKGNVTRDFRCSTKLYNEIRVEFAGKNRLFEHEGKQYSSKASTNRIKQLAERTKGKPVTTYMIRHYRGTVCVTDSIKILRTRVQQNPVFGASKIGTQHE